MSGYLIIMLHSFMGNIYENLYYQKYLNRILKNNVKFVDVKAPLRSITIYNNKKYNAWYDYYTEFCTSREEEINCHHLFAQCNRIHNLIDKESQKTPLDKIYIMGYSQGACTALSAGITYPKPLGGIIGLKGHIPSCIYDHKQGVKQRILVAHGKKDSVIGYKIAEESYKLYKKRGYDITFLSQDKANHDASSGIREQMKYIEKFIV